MAFQLFTNILIMFVWLLFFNTYTAPDALIGFVVGAVVVRILIHFRDEEFYLRRGLLIVKLALVFLRELLYANLQVMKIIASPRINISPGIIAVPSRLESATEKSIFGVMMSLTPGTMVIEFSDDGKYAYIHSLNASDKEAIINKVQTVYEKGIMEVTRPNDV